jgi:hypothetical protein
LYDPSRVQRFREDVLLDFANLESSITRIQLVLSSNARQRERYAAEKAKILETAQAVRDNTVELRANLEDAQEALERRKGYDEMATKILNDKKLQSRDEAKAEIEKLEKEIEDLQQESAEYETTWVSRREQFDNIVREGEAMIKQIKGIKDDPEPEKDDENMEDSEGEDETGKDVMSGSNTPAHDGRSPRPTDAGDSTPMQDSGDAGDGTPARPANKFLGIDDATRPNSRVSSPLAQPAQLPDDIDMAETPFPDAVAADQAKTSDSVAVSEAATPAQDISENLESMDET